MQFMTMQEKEIRGTVTTRFSEMIELNVGKKMLFIVMYFKAF